jgi:PHD/YefM family antitoxin component YafN of YafNO toxin-antitoxin module
MLDTCLQQGPQTVSKRGVDAAVLVPIEQWRRLQAARPTLKQLLLSPEPRADIPVPPRGQRRRRPPAELS